MFRRFLLAAVVSAALVAAGCGDDEKQKDQSAGDAQSYCEAFKELEDARERFFEGTRQTAEEFAEAEEKFIRENVPAVDKLERTAPESIKADVAKYVAYLKADAGVAIDPKAPDSEPIDALIRIEKFEKANCR